MADKDKARIKALEEENGKLRFELNRSKFGGGGAQKGGKDPAAEIAKLQEEIQGKQSAMAEQAEKIFNIEQEKTKL